MCSRFTLGLIFGLLASLAVPAPTSAHDFAVPGSRGAAMGGAMSATSEDGHAVWYNPAMLVLSDSFRGSIQYSGLWGSLNADMQNFGSLGQIPYFQANGSDGTLSVNQTRLRIERLFQDEAAPEALHGLNLSAVLPVHRIITELPIRITFGLSLFVPGAGTKVVRVQGVTPDTPFYPVYGSRIQRLKILFGVGFEVIPSMLSLGVGASMFTDITGEVGSLTPMTTFDASKPKGEQENPAPSKATFGQELSTSMSPIVGLRFQPLEWLNFGAYYRHRHGMELDFNVAAGLDVNMGYSLEAEMPYYLRSSFFFVPSSTGAAVDFSLVKGLRLTAQFDYVFWSQLKDYINISDFDIVPGMTNDEGALIPLEEYGDFKVRSYAVPTIRSRDVISPKAGLEWTLGGFTAIRLGYAYTQSALETEQEYENLLLDNDYHTVSGGLGFSFRDPLGYLKREMLLDLHFASHILAPRYNQVGLLDEVSGYHAKGVVKTSGYFLSFGVEFTVQM